MVGIRNEDKDIALIGLGLGTLVGGGSAGALGAVVGGSVGILAGSFAPRIIRQFKGR